MDSSPGNVKGYLAPSFIARQLDVEEESPVDFVKLDMPSCPGPMPGPELLAVPLEYLECWDEGARDLQAQSCGGLAGGVKVGGKS